MMVLSLIINNNNILEIYTYYLTVQTESLNATNNSVALLPEQLQLISSIIVE